MTTGAVVGTAIAARALISPGDTVLMETPTYPNVFPTLAQLRARVSAVPVEPSGWDVATMTSTIRASGARAAILLPDFHNPTGNLMADDERARVAAALLVTHLGGAHRRPHPLGRAGLRIAVEIHGRHRGEAR